MSQAERANRPDGVSGKIQHFLFAGHGDSRDTQGGPQFGPGHLSGTCHKHQDEFARCDSEEQAAYDLFRGLPPVLGSLLERLRYSRMLEEAVGDR